MDADVEKRARMEHAKEVKNAMAEKRKKLEELKQRKAAKAAQIATAIPEVPAPVTGQTVSPAADKAAVPDVDTMVAELLSAQEAEKAKQAAKEAALAPKRSRPSNLVVSAAVHVLDIPPEHMECYGKETQTDITGDDDLPPPPSPSWEETGPLTPQMGRARGATFYDTGSKRASTNLSKYGSTVEKMVRPAGTVSDVDEELTASLSYPASHSGQTAHAGGTNITLSENEVQEIMQSEPFCGFVARSSRLIERAMVLAEDYDFMVDYGSDGAFAAADAVTGGFKEAITFELNDSLHKGRVCSSLEWSANHQELLLASYAVLPSRLGNFSRSTRDQPEGLCLIWSCKLQSRPEYSFECQSSVSTATFARFSPWLIWGGTDAGQLVVWDMRAGRLPVQRTTLSIHGHTYPVHSLSVVGTEHAHSLVSASTDGRCCVWSMETLNEPVDVMELTYKSQTKEVTRDVTTTCMQFQPGEVNNFWVGSDNGSIYAGERQGANPPGIVAKYDGHTAPVTALDFRGHSLGHEFSDLYISTSMDWSLRLWSTKQARSIAVLEDATEAAYDVKWHPTNVALFASCDGTGSLNLWNLLAAESETPQVKAPISTAALNKCKWSGDGRKIATGDSLGVVRVHDIAVELITSHADDVTRMEATLQRLGKDEQHQH